VKTSFWKVCNNWVRLSFSMNIMQESIPPRRLRMAPTQAVAQIETRKKVIHEEHLENPSQSFPGRTLEPDSGQKYFEFQIPAQAGGGDVLMPGPGSHAKPGGIGVLDAGGGGMKIVPSAIILALDSSGGGDFIPPPGHFGRLINN
jgi:hypothetical protein